VKETKISLRCKQTLRDDVSDQGDEMKNAIFLAVASLTLVFCLLSWLPRVSAQSESEEPPVRSVNTHLTDSERRGEGLFLQRCSLCHLPKVSKPYKSFGPNLTGVLKGATPAKEKAVRLFINNGVPDQMPGFQYALNSSDMDDLINYLKTL